MKRAIKLTKYEQSIEDALERGEFISVSKEDNEKILKAIQEHKKSKVLNIRISAADLNGLKEKARKLGIRYQTYVGEILHRVAKA